MVHLKTKNSTTPLKIPQIPNFNKSAGESQLVGKKKVVKKKKVVTKVKAIK